MVQVVSLTSTILGYRSEMTVEPGAANGLIATSEARCQHIRAIAVELLAEPTGNVGPQARRQIREVLADLLDLSNLHAAGDHGLFGTLCARISGRLTKALRTGARRPLHRGLVSPERW